MTPRTRYLVGVDLGGTNIVAGALAEDGSDVVAMRSEPTKSDQGADAVIDRIVRMIDTVIGETVAQTGASRDDFAGIGVGAPGPLDRKRGIVITTPNLGWTDFPLRDVISAATRLPVRIDNDANCATLGEWWLGAAAGANNVIGMTIGTGIGGGIILDGRLYHGASDVAGEIGHTTIDVTGRRCKCGNYGCLEAYASGPSIADRAREAVASDDGGLLVRLVGGDLARITAATVDEAARAGDPLARRLVEETGRYLGAGLVSLVHAFNPRRLVLGGGVIEGMPDVAAAAADELRRRAMPVFLEELEIVGAGLGAEAGVVGAGLLAHGRFGEEGA
jgi:glucokinase